MPRIPVKIAMNVGNPELAFEFCQLPNAGVGLARLEFIINNEIGVHPRACLEYDGSAGPPAEASWTKRPAAIPMRAPSSAKSWSKASPPSPPPSGPSR